MTDCDLYEVDSPDFMGLESSLELLDLSGNNLTFLPNHVFQEYDFLRTLIFRENRIDTFNPSTVNCLIKECDSDHGASR